MSDRFLIESRAGAFLLESRTNYLLTQHPNRNALLKEDGTGGFLLEDGSGVLDLEGTFSVDAVVAGQHFEFSVAAVLSSEPHSEFSVAAVLIGAPPAFGNAFSSEFEGGAFGGFSVPINAVLLGTSGTGAMRDLFLLESRAGAFLLESRTGYLLTRRPEFWVSAVISTRHFLVNAWLIVKVTRSFGVVAVIRAPNQRALFTIFAIKGERHGAGSFTVNAAKYDASVYSHFYVNALRAIHPTGSFHVGAAFILPGEPIASIFLDAAIVGTGDGQFLLEAFIWAQRTVVYEGEGEIVSVLETTSARLTFPGINGVGPNQLYGPFYPAAFLPVTLTVWEPPSTTGANIGVESANEDLWVKFSDHSQAPAGSISVTYGPTTTITMYPAYSSEPHYAYAWAPSGLYDASMTGDALLSYSQRVDVVLSHPAPTIDAWIVGTIGEPFTLDAEIVGLEKVGFFALSADLSAQGEKRSHFTVEASILSRTSLFFRMGAWITVYVGTKASLTLDAFFRPIPTIFTLNATIGALARVSQSPVEVLVSPTDAFARISQSVIEVLIVRANGQILIDAIRGQTTTSDFTVRAAIGQGAGFDVNAMFVPAHFMVNAVKGKTATGSFVLSALLLATTPKTFMANANIFASYSGSSTLDAWITLIPVPLFRINAVLFRSLGGKDVLLKEDGTGGFLLEDGSGVLDLEGILKFHVDAQSVPRHFTLDAVLSGSHSFTLAYQWLTPTHMGTTTVDALLSAVGDHQMTLNAVIGTRHSLRFYLAASIAALPSVYTVDAVVAPWFGVDAWISSVGGGLGGFSVGAYVRGSSYIIFSEDDNAPMVLLGNPPVLTPAIKITDPLGNPPVLTRKFAIKIEAGFPQSPSQADAALAALTLSQIATLQAQIAILQAQIDALLCIPVAERISSENAAIKDLNERIAALEHQLLVARHQDPGEFWMDAVSKMQVYLDIYRALTNPTNAQTVAYETDLKTYNYDLLRLRMAREIQRTWVDITGDCIWSQTDFTQMARTGPGTFTITMKGAHPEFVGGEEIHFEIDDLRVFGGWVSSVEKGYFFDAAVAPKTVLHGTDYNILFDRLVVRNWPWEFANHHKTGGNAGPYRNWPAFKKGTMDDAMIEYVFQTYLLPDLPMGFDYETGVFPIATPAPESPWVMPDPGSPARVFMQSVSQITSGVWCIDPYMVLQYHDRETVTAPYPLTDGLGGISCRALSITTDISQMIDDDLIWGTLGKTIEGEIMVTHEVGDGHWRERYWLAAIASVQQYIQNLLADASRTTAQNKELTVYRARLAAYKKNLAAARANPEASSYALYGFWQYGEFRQDIFHQKWLDIRARAILLRYDDPIMMATATVWDPGYQAGQVVNVKSSVYGIDINLVIRQLHISFTVAKEPVGERYYALPQYDLTMGLDPESPWNIYDFLPYPGMSTPGLGMDVTGG
jgi:hypothetical protein